MFAMKKRPDTIKSKKLWSVFRSLGLAPTPTEFSKIMADMDKDSNGLIKLNNFLGSLSVIKVSSQVNKPADIS